MRSITLPASGNEHVTAPAAPAAPTAPAAPGRARRPGTRAPRLALPLTVAWLGLCGAGLGCATAATEPPREPEAPTTERLGSVAEALSHHRERYEVGWRTESGEVAYSAVTGVTVEPDGQVRIELAEPSLLWGTTGPTTLEGHWKDAGGEGDLWLEFAADYSSAKGWWNNGGTTERLDLWLRLGSTP